MTKAAAMKLARGPVVIILAHLVAWDLWLDVFEVTRAVVVVLCAAWFWKSTAPRPPQLELWPA